MVRGRTPVPDALNDLKGDPGKRRRHQVSVVLPTGTPEAPDYLCDVARELWKELVSQMAAMHVLTLADATALTACCEAWARYREAADYVRQYGVVNPMYKVVAKTIIENHAIVAKYLLEFGFTPAARARMRYKPDDKPKASKWGNRLKVHG